MFATRAKRLKRLTDCAARSLILIALNELSSELAFSPSDSILNIGSKRTVTFSAMRQLVARSTAVRTAAKTSSESARVENEKGADAFGRLSS